VVVAKVKNALRIVAADARALECGLAPGLTLADARARVPELAVAEEDRAADRALLEEVAEWCDRYTPLVGLDGADGVMLDVTGCAHLFGGEAGLRTEAEARLARFGLSVRTAIAGTPDAARAVSRFTRGGIVRAGRDGAAVRPLPVAALGLDAERLTVLARAGLKTVADLADRPRAPLAARFGREIIDRLARTLGEVDHPISPRRPVPALLAERRFPEPIARTEDVVAVLARLAGELARALERRGEGGRRFEASVFRTDGAVRRIAVSTAKAMRDPAALTRLFSERLDALADPLDPGFGFDMVRLSALTAEDIAPAQPRLDGGAGGEETVAELVDRLGARLGAARILCFLPKDSHIPERAARFAPAVSNLEVEAQWDMPAQGEPPLRPLRMFDPPEPVETLAEVPDGPPLRFRWRRVLYEIARAEGPERIAPEWWREAEAGRTRDYYRVEDTQGRRFWLFREGLYERETTHPRWFLHGLFA
jgi:protein ImuB